MKTKRRDLQTRLERARIQLDEAPLPPGLKARMSERVSQRVSGGVRSRRPGYGAAALAFGAVWAVLLGVVWLRAEPVTAPVQPIPGMVLDAPEASPQPLAFDVEPDGTLNLTRGTAALRLPEDGVRVVAQGPARLRASPDELLLLEGRIRLTVEPRAPGSTPFRVEVSHGRIEVLGTTFDVVQHADGGEVTLHEGRIRFVSLDGRTRELSPGETLSWPLPPEAAPAPATPEPTTGARPPLAVRRPIEKPHPQQPQPPPAAPLDDELFERLESLRAAESFREAAELIARVLETPREPPLEPADRERLSFELGTLLGNHLDDRARACARWLAHQQSFPGGRYGAEVERAQRAHGCDTTKGPTP